MFIYISMFVTAMAGSVRQAEAYLEQSTKVSTQVALFARPLVKTKSVSRMSSHS